MAGKFEELSRSTVQSVNEQFTFYKEELRRATKQSDYYPMDLLNQIVSTLCRVTSDKDLNECLNSRSYKALFKLLKKIMEKSFDRPDLEKKGYTEYEFDVIDNYIKLYKKIYHKLSVDERDESRHGEPSDSKQCNSVKRHFVSKLQVHSNSDKQRRKQKSRTTPLQAVHRKKQSISKKIMVALTDGFKANPAEDPHTCSKYLTTFL